MGQAVLLDGSDQRADHVVLTDDLVGRLRTILAVQRLVGDVFGHEQASPELPATA